MVDGQIVAGQDALEDWRDIIPDDVDEMLERDQERERYDENDDQD